MELYQVKLNQDIKARVKWRTRKINVCLVIGGMRNKMCVREKLLQMEDEMMLPGQSNIFMLSPDSMLFCVVSSTLLFIYLFLLFLISTSLGRRKLEPK